MSGTGAQVYAVFLGVEFQLCAQDWTLRHFVNIQ